MHKYNLKFISDHDLYQHVKDTVGKYRTKINLKDFKNNLLDPIKLTFDSKVYGKNINEIIESETLRQIDKSNSNHIGYFHQNIFHYIGTNWNVPKKGFDIINTKEHYYVEMKNKHNTMNSSSSQKTYMRMLSQLVDNPNSKCLLVEAIAKKSQDIAWVVSLDGISSSKEQIRRVSLDKFYSLVTKDKLAFKKLCEILPTVIDDVIQDLDFSTTSNTVYEELLEISPNIMKSIFLISFQTYDGFDEISM